jgi:drug/metabolite transporter (DMT)-like permease
MDQRMMPGQMGGKEWMLLFALSGLWGGSFFFYKVLVAAVPPFTVVLARVGLAAIALHVFILSRGHRMPRDARLWRGFLGMGILNNVIPFTLIVFGETRISSGLASVLNATTPIFAVLVAHVLTADEKLSGRKFAGVLFGFAGVAVLIGPGLGDRLTGGSLAAELACLLAAFVYALAGVYGRRFRGVPPLQVAAGQVTSSTAVLLPFSIIVDRPWTLPIPGAGVWAALAGLALLSTALAFVIYFRILAVAGATNLLLVTFLLPISALLLGAAILGETITPGALAGMAMIGCGLAAIDGRIPRWLSGRLRFGRA